MIHELRVDRPVHFRLPTGEILAIWWDDGKRKFETLQAPESVFKLYQPVSPAVTLKPKTQSREILLPNDLSLPGLTETTVWYKVEGPDKTTPIPTPDEMLSQAEQGPVGGMG